MGSKQAFSPQTLADYPLIDDWSIVAAQCLPADYSASAVARAVEDCDAHLLNLNVVDLGDADSPRLVFELRANRRDASSIARSLERYGFEVLRTRGSADSDTDSDTARNRFENLIRYLQI